MMTKLTIAILTLLGQLTFANAEDTIHRFPANSENIPACHQQILVQQKLKPLRKIDYKEIPKSYLVAVKATYQVDSDSIFAQTTQDFTKRKQAFECAQVKSDINSINSMYAPVLIAVNGSAEPNVIGFKKIWQFSILSKPSENLIGLWNASSRLSQNQRLVGKSFFGRFAEVSFYESDSEHFYMLIQKTEANAKSTLLIEFESHKKLPKKYSI
jgi:hypothetical protein